MFVDLRRRGNGRSRVLFTCQATVPMLIILMTSVSCSRPAADMPEPHYRMVERVLPFSSRLTDGENQQLAQRRVDGQPMLRAEQRRTSQPPQPAKVHAPETTRASPPRPASGKTNPPPLLNREKEQLFQQFLEWRSRQKDVP
jgi:hypothetical protein